MLPRLQIPLPAGQRFRPAKNEATEQRALPGRSFVATVPAHGRHGGLSVFRRLQEVGFDPNVSIVLCSDDSLICRLALHRLFVCFFCRNFDEVLSSFVDPLLEGSSMAESCSGFYEEECVKVSVATM